MEDAALYYAERAKERSAIIQKLGLEGKQFILTTIHRAENTDVATNLENIIDSLNELAKTHPVIVPLHPRTKKIIIDKGYQTNFTIIDPVGYFDMIMLLQSCSLVITDSGGLQKESFFFNKLCITTREQTEWVELVDNGYNFIAGTNKQKIVSLATQKINSPFPAKLNLYGNGSACYNICRSLTSL